jgi:microcystin-dependent protein
MSATLINKSLTCAIAIIGAFSVLAKAQSVALPFQGILTDQKGDPVTSTAALTLIFRIYESPSGGKATWEEIQPNVAVIQGRFNVLLGSRTLLPSAGLFSKTVYLGITIDDGDKSSVDIEMRPRQAIVPVPFAVSASNADKLNGHDWSDLLVGASNDPSTAKIRADHINLLFDPSLFTINDSTVALNSGSISAEYLGSHSVTSDKIADGLVTPIGGVVAYAGHIDDQHSLPPGWMPCVGRPLKSSEYRELYAAIGTAYGDGRDDQDRRLAGYDFNLPDFRGYFLRGTDAGAGRDPDIDRRTAPRSGGNTKGLVGSIQTDEIKQHSHHFDISATDYQVGGPTNGLRGDDYFHKGMYPGGFNTDVSPKQPDGKESRPINISVNWIIRVK